MQNEIIHFDKRLTNICKGIAIILMIIHHIFPGMEGYGLKIGSTWVMAEIAILGKVVVSIYLFLSGYGLCESLKGKKLLWNTIFYKWIYGI